MGPLSRKKSIIEDGRYPMRTTLLALFALTSSIALGQDVTPAAAVAAPSCCSQLASFAKAEGFYLRALGNLAATYPEGSGGYVGYGIFYPDSYLLMLQAGYVKYSGNEQPGGGEPSLSAVHLLAGPRYYFVTEGVVMPFVTVNIGANIVTEIPVPGPSETSVHFAWQFAFGTNLAVAGPFGLELAAKYNAHFFPDERMMTGFEYGAGVTWRLE